MVPADRQLEASPLVPKSFWSPKRMVVIIVLVVVLPILGNYVGRPLLRKWQNREAVALAKAASEAMAAEDFATASRLLAKASGKSGSNPVVVRAVAAFLSKTGSHEQSLGFWRRLDSDGAATPEDRLNMAVSLAKSGHSVEARKTMESLSAGLRDSFEGAELESLILKQEGRFAEADDVLRSACKREPERPECMLVLAGFDIISPFNEVRKGALDSLWKLTRSGGVHALEALDRLAVYPGLTEGEVDELLSILSSRKDAPMRHRLLLLAAYMRVHPEEKSAVIARETERHRGETLEDASEFLRWLDGLNEHKLILSLVPAEKASKSADLFVAYANALVGEKKWTDLRALLKSAKSLPISSIDFAILNARCSYGLGESGASVTGRLQEALHQVIAVRSVEGAQKLAASAMSMGHDDVAMEAYRSLAKFPQHRYPMLEQILQLEIKMQKTDEMLATVREILHERPQQETMILTELYLRLLLGIEMETASDDIEQLTIGREYGRSAKSFLKAFAAMRRSDSAKAREYADGVEPSTLVAGQRAVLSAIYRSAGDARKAFELAEKIPEQLLLSEERTMMEHSL